MRLALTCTHDCVIPGGGVTPLQEKDGNTEHHLRPGPATQHLLLPSPSPFPEAQPHFLSFLTPATLPLASGSLYPSLCQSVLPTTCLQGSAEATVASRLAQHLLYAFREPQSLFLSA